MNVPMGHDRATRPEDLGRLFVERANAGDVESLLMLYEPDAVLHFPPGHVTRGVDAIREVFTQFLASRPTFSVDIKPTLSCGELALTSSRWTMKGTGPDGQPLTMGGTTAEVARRQPDGTWRWVIDEPDAGAELSEDDAGAVGRHPAG